MRIRYGCELSIVVSQPTPASCLVDLHPDCRPNIIEETPLSISPLAPLSDEADAFGNRLRRFIALPGETTLKLSGTIADSGRPDARDPSLAVLPVNELPA